MARAALVLVLAYLVGSIPWGYLIGRLHGLDIRRHGSCNIGATNVRRVLGRAWGRVCFVLDVGKGVLPVALAPAFACGHGGALAFFPLVAGAATVAGHIWPVTLKFRGGKGVATTIGAVALIAPWPVFAALVVWVLVFLIWRYVSAASVAAALALPVAGLVERRWRGGTPSWAVVVLLLALAAVIVIRHRQNIIRLLHGTEYRFQPGVGHEGRSAQ